MSKMDKLGKQIEKEKVTLTSRRARLLKEISEINESLKKLDRMYLLAKGEKIAVVRTEPKKLGGV